MITWSGYECLPRRDSWRGRRSFLTNQDHPVRITLLSEKQSAVVGEVLFPGIARDEREEVGGPSIALGPQDAPEPLCPLLPRPEPARDLDAHVGVRQVDGEVP